MSSETPFTTVFPPKASKQNHKHIDHNCVREDPYYWMRNRNNPDVIAYIEEENSYTEATLSASN